MSDLPWFPYLGLKTLDALAERQFFFAAFYTFFTTTNAYKVGGSLAFAPVLQNNPTQDLLRYAERWAAGESPAETGFEVETKSGKRDCSGYMVVSELFGFLNLHLQPFHNSVVPAYSLYRREEDESIFPAQRRIGEETRQWLEANAVQRGQLAGRFRKLSRDVGLKALVTMEGIRSPAVERRRPDDAAAQVDVVIEEQLAAAADRRTRELSDVDAAAIMVHLYMDWLLYERHLGDKPVPEVAVAREGSEPHRAPAPSPTKQLTLPPSLQPIANDALAYLRAGFHVLLAGAPGTGKTTIAQFVGHAWNAGLSTVPPRIAPADAPLTTVGNSAWAPFHTIGGILPDAGGRFVSQPGFFIDPESAEGDEWRLRGECVVLDEMNRADLDRCIGDALSGPEQERRAGSSGRHPRGRAHSRLRALPHGGHRQRRDARRHRLPDQRGSRPPFPADRASRRDPRGDRALPRDRRGGRARGPARGRGPGARRLLQPLQRCQPPGRHRAGRALADGRRLLLTSQGLVPRRPADVRRVPRQGPDQPGLGDDPHRSGLDPRSRPAARQGHSGAGLSCRGRMSATGPSAFADEIRAYLLGRVSKDRETAHLTSVHPGRLPTSRILDWWIFEGRPYGGLEGSLAANWPVVIRQDRLLRSTYNPTWRAVQLPEGEIDWVATALSSTVTATPEYTCKASRAGLSLEEMQALTGWESWIAGRWRRHVDRLGTPPDAKGEPPWPADQVVELSLLRRWAHVARRSRWPLLRNVVAESLRASFEAEAVDALALPTERARLFELACLVRVLKAISPCPAALRWLDVESERNTVQVPGIRCRYQLHVPKEQVLEAPEYGGGLRQAALRHDLRVPQYVDALFEFEQPRGGFHGILLEAKSGGQEPSEAIWQLKCYRSALRDRLPGPLLVWGVTERPHSPGSEVLPLRSAGAGAEAGEDLWIFSGAEGIATGLQRLGLSESAPRPRPAMAD